MNIANSWNRIAEWFRDRSERNKLIRSFNETARAAFITGDAPTALKASFSRGESSYRHEFSALLNTGFRIQALAGRQLTKEETDRRSCAFRRDISTPSGRFGMGHIRSLQRPRTLRMPLVFDRLCQHRKIY